MQKKRTILLFLLGLASIILISMNVLAIPTQDNYDLSEGIVIDGINLYQGNLDLSIGLLNYNSLFQTTSWVGDKWALDFGYILKQDNEYLLVMNSKAYKLVQVGANNYQTEKYQPWKIYQEDDSSWVVIFEDGTKNIFGNINNKNGQAYKWDLTQIVDSNGNAVDYSYTKENYNFDDTSLEVSYLNEITDSYGEKTQFIISDRIDLADNNGKNLKKLDKIVDINPDNSYDGETKLVYDYTNGDLTLKEIKRCYNEQCLPETRFEYTNGILRKIINPQGGRTEYVFSANKVVQKILDNHIGTISEYNYEYGQGEDYDYTSIILPEDHGSVKYYFETQFPIQGLLKKTETLNNNSEVIQSSSLIWQDEENNGIYKISLFSEQENSLGQIGKTDYVYDDYLNIVEVQEYGNLARPRDERRTINQYNYNLDKWILNNHVNTRIYDYDNNKKYESWSRYNTNGNLIETEEELVGGENPITKFYYNEKGELIKTESPEGAIIEYVYDDYGNLIKQDYGEYANSYEYYPDGLLKKARDARGVGSFSEYDNLNRVKKITSDDGSLVEYDYALDLRSFTTETKIDENKTNIYTENYDGFGNLLLGDENGVKVDYQYDNLGNMIRVSNPYTESENPEAYTTYEYYQDPLNQLKRTIYPDNETYVEYFYGPDYDMTKDEAGYYWKNTYDYDGNLIKVEEDSRDGIRFNVQEIYAYDSLGNLMQIKNDFFTTKYEYDSLGRNTREYNNALDYHYEYNNDNNLIKRTDTAGQITSYIYDPLGRLVKVDYPEAPLSGQDIEFIYDKDLLIEEKGSQYSKAYSYDKLGRLIKKTLSVMDTNFDIEYAYDSAGNLIKTKTPCDTISVGFDDFGRVERENRNGIISTSQYNEENKVSNMLISAGDINISFGYKYDVNRYISRKTISSQNKSININQEFDPNKKILKISDTENISLDYKGRLNTFNIETKKIDLNYDKFNNVRGIEIKNKSVIQKRDTINYDEKGRPIETGNNAIYDKNNNLKKISTKDNKEYTIFEYDYENRMIKLLNSDNEYITYLFDHSGNVILMNDSGQIYIYPTDNCVLRLGEKIQEGMQLKSFLSNIVKWVQTKLILVTGKSMELPEVEISPDYNRVRKWIKGDTGYEYKIVPFMQLIFDDDLSEGFKGPGSTCSDVCQTIGRQSGACISDSRCAVKIGNTGIDIETGEETELNICEQGQTCCCTTGFSSKCDKDDIGYGTRACQRKTTDWCGSNIVCVGIGGYDDAESAIKAYNGLDVGNMTGQVEDWIADGPKVKIGKNDFGFQCCNAETEKCGPIESEVPANDALGNPLYTPDGQRMHEYKFGMTCKKKETENICSGGNSGTGNVIKSVTGMYGEIEEPPEPDTSCSLYHPCTEGYNCVEGVCMPKEEDVSEDWCGSPYPADCTLRVEERNGRCISLCHCPGDEHSTVMGSGSLCGGEQEETQYDSCEIPVKGDADRDGIPDKNDPKPSGGKEENTPISISPKIGKGVETPTMKCNKKRDCYENLGGFTADEKAEGYTYWACENGICVMKKSDDPSDWDHDGVPNNEDILPDNPFVGKTLNYGGFTIRKCIDPKKGCLSTLMPPKDMPIKKIKPKTRLGGLLLGIGDFIVGTVTSIAPVPKPGEPLTTLPPAIIDLKNMVNREIEGIRDPLKAARDFENQLKNSDLSWRYQFSPEGMRQIGQFVGPYFFAIGIEAMGVYLPKLKAPTSTKSGTSIAAELSEESGMVEGGLETAGETGAAPRPRDTIRNPVTAKQARRGIPTREAAIKGQEVELRNLIEQRAKRNPGYRQKLVRGERKTRAEKELGKRLWEEDMRESLEGNIPRGPYVGGVGAAKANPTYGLPHAKKIRAGAKPIRQVFDKNKGWKLILETKPGYQIKKVIGWPKSWSDEQLLKYAQELDWHYSQINPAFQSEFHTPTYSTTHGKGGNLFRK